MMAIAASASLQHGVCARVATIRGVSVLSTPRHHHLLHSWKGMPLSSCSCSKTRDAKERLYICALIDKSSGKVKAILDSEVVVDGSGSLEALQRKKQELKAAEKLANADDKEAQIVKSAYVQVKQDLEAAHTFQKSRRVEVSRQQKQLTLQAKELKEVKRTLREQQRRMQSLQEQICEKQSELSQSKSSLLEKDKNLAEMAKQSKLKSSQLQAANSIVSQQSLGIDELKTCLKEKENELRRSEEERFLKQEKLSRAEADLEIRVVAYLDAKKEMKLLQQELARCKATDMASKQEIQQTNALLNEVCYELEESQRSVVNFRQAIEEQGVRLQHQLEEMAAQEGILRSQVLKLDEAMAEAEKEREQVRLATLSCKSLEAEVKREKDWAIELQTNLDKEKAALQESSVEVNSLRCKLQQLESGLSDTQLSLQLKEAQLVTVKLELHQLLSDLNSLRSTLDEKDHDLQITRRMVEEVQLEIAQLKLQVKNEQEKRTKASALLHDTENELKVVKLDLDTTKVKLLEATSVMQEFAEFSRILADLSSEGKQSTYLESSVLMDTNYELFAANHALLERELELKNFHQKSSQDLQKWKEVEEELLAVKRCLDEKHLELQAVQGGLASKEQELKQISGQWEAREEELARMRDEVMEEARNLSDLHLLSPAEVDKQSEKAKLELEAAKQQVELVISSLQQLVQLSSGLVEHGNISSFPSKISIEHMRLGRALSHPVDTLHLHCESVADTAKNLNNKKHVGYSQDVYYIDDININGGERDEAFESTKQAVIKLNKLTQRLVVEAGIETGRKPENGFFNNTLVTQLF